MSGTRSGSKSEPRKGTKSMVESVVAGGHVAGNVVCDLDGVVYLGEQAVAGAERSLAELDSAGYHLLFVTNNSMRSPSSTAARIREVVGYPARPSQVVGSAEASASMLIGSGPVLVLGGDGIRAALADVGVEETADPDRAVAVVVGLDLSINYQRLREAASAIRRGARFIATNTDTTFPTPGGLWPGAGSIVAAVAAAAGIEPEVAGKPHPPIRALIRGRLRAGDVWMVGDRPDTDLAMAEAEGWRSVLVLTGVVDDADSVAHRPDLVLGSIAELPGALASPAGPRRSV